MKIDWLGQEAFLRTGRKDIFSFVKNIFSTLALQIAFVYAIPVLYLLMVILNLHCQSILLLVHMLCPTANSHLM